VRRLSTTPGRVSPSATETPATELSRGQAFRASLQRSNSDLAAPPSPPDVGEDKGRVEEQVDPRQTKKRYTWLRFDNSEPAREARRQVSRLTREVVAASGYKLEGRSVRLEHVKDMLSGSKRLAPSLGNLAPPFGSGAYMSTELTRPKGLALEVALELQSRHRDSVAVLSAASAYHCGGGFLTGGRHALEEAMCVQTSLFESLTREEKKFMQSLDRKSADADHIAYVPVDGVVCSPKVEVFRGGSDQGYPFMDRPTTLGAVISVAMFNCNPSIRDAPMDAPVDLEEYREAVRKKFRSVLTATVRSGCSALVMADAGCGVYKNDPAIVGQIFGEVLRKEFWCHVKEVAVCGMSQWQDAVFDAVATAGQKPRRGLSDLEPLLDPSPPVAVAVEPQQPRRVSQPRPAAEIHVGGGGQSPPPPPRPQQPPPQRTPEPPQQAAAFRPPRACRFGCGRPVKEGVMPSGKPYSTCCRACGVTKGSGRHDDNCGC